MSQGRFAARLPAAALVLLCFLWGFTWLLAKIGLAEAPPFAFAAQRCVGGALALVVALKLSGRSFALVAPRQTLVIGLTQVTGFVALQTWALVEGGPGKTAVLIFTMPIWTLLLARIVLGERVRGAQWVAVSGTLIGLVLIIAPWDLKASALGKMLGVAAAVCWAVGTILVKRLRGQIAAELLALTMWQTALGCVPLVVLALVVPERAIHWSLSYAGILLFMAVGATALGWWLWIYILDRVPAWEASLSVLGTPVVAIVASTLLLGEKFRATEIVGMVLIVAGLALLSLFSWAAARR